MQEYCVLWQKNEHGQREERQCRRKKVYKIGCGIKEKGAGRRRRTDVGSTQTDMKNFIGFGFRNNQFAQDLDDIVVRGHTTGRIRFRHSPLRDVKVRYATIFLQ